MNLLYAGGYKERFRKIARLLEDFPKGAQVLELCFGDTYIAEFCKNNGYGWLGIDLNAEFVKHAQRLGFDARLDDLTMVDNLPKAHACIIVGSLYHFHPNELSLLTKM
jgi:hypothetical protein